MEFGQKKYKIIVDYKLRNKMKFGLIIPSSNTTMETEFWRMVSGWATVHTSRMKLTEITVEDLKEMEDQMWEAVFRLVDADIDILGYGCTSGSLFKGKGHGRRIEEKIEEKTGITTVATAQAVIEAMIDLQVKRICVATPYTEEINKLEKRYIEQNGIDVLNIMGLGIINNQEVGKKDPDVAFELAKQVFRPETQGLFISCTNFRTIEVIDRLEREMGVPVISSNTATLWAMMRKAGIEKEIRGYGSLFRLPHR